MTLQRFQGDIEGFYVGEPDVSGFTRASAKSKHFRLRIYRAVVRRVKLLDAPTTGPVVTSGPTALPETSPEPIPPPPEPLPPGTFAQDVVPDARLTPVRHRAGWFEGPIHDVRVADFRSTHQKREAGRIYGRFVGHVTAHFALPPAPLPPPAEALLAELSAPPEPSNGAPAVSGPGEAEAAASADGDEPGDAADHDDELALSAVSAKAGPKTKSQAPLLLLVAAFTIALVALCSPSRALIWLVFLLPTLLVRRILRGALSESPGARAFGAVSVLGQLACFGFLGVSFWASGCKELSFLPVACLVLGVFVTSVLPSNLPLLVNGAALGLVLTTWCSALGKRCAEPKPATAITNRPTAHDPGVPRTNADGSWPRVPPRVSPAEKKP